jgi:hypothetical protein
MAKTFIPRRFKALIDEFGEDDGGVASFTFKVKSITKDKIYEERNPEYLDGNPRGVIIDDNGYWWHCGTPSFNKRFAEVL